MTTKICNVEIFADGIRLFPAELPSELVPWEEVPEDVASHVDALFAGDDPMLGTLYDARRAALVPEMRKVALLAELAKIEPDPAAAKRAMTEAYEARAVAIADERAAEAKRRAEEATPAK